MLNLDPAKILIIAVVAVILLGPERLPTFARQVGGAWRTFTAYRHRMEQEVRSSLPDLPTSAEIARLARSPSALLDRLSTMSPGEGSPGEGSPGEGQPPASSVPAEVPGAAPSPLADPGMN
jgi:Sec-independent protein translocase protein TatA